MQNDDADGAVNIFNPFTAYVDWSWPRNSHSMCWTSTVWSKVILHVILLAMSEIVMLAQLKWYAASCIGCSWTSSEKVQLIVFACPKMVDEKQEINFLINIKIFHWQLQVVTRLCSICVCFLPGFSVVCMILKPGDDWPRWFGDHYWGSCAHLVTVYISDQRLEKF
jgi:hypothetical protein